MYQRYSPASNTDAVARSIWIATRPGETTRFDKDSLPLATT